LGANRTDIINIPKRGYRKRKRKSHIFSSFFTTTKATLTKDP